MNVVVVVVAYYWPLAIRHEDCAQNWWLWLTTMMWIQTGTVDVDVGTDCARPPVTRLWTNVGTSVRAGDSFVLCFYASCYATDLTDANWCTATSTARASWADLAELSCSSWTLYWRRRMDWPLQPTPQDQQRTHRRQDDATFEPGEIRVCWWTVAGKCNRRL